MPIDPADDMLKEANAIEVSIPDQKSLHAMLYGVENLRKRGDDDGGEDE